MKVDRPPIKNNLNEHLKIYYAYRDQAKREECIEHRPPPSFRLIPDQPPIRRPVVSSEPRDATPPVFDQPAIRRPGVSSEPQDFIPVKRETPPIFDQPLIRRPVVSSEPRALISSEQRDVTPPIFDEQPIRRPVISSEQRDFAPPPIRRPVVSSEQRDAAPPISMDHSSLQRSTSDPSCPLCRTAFDVSGVFRPVNDACGHTTCFQCFKSTMIKGTGCILCQEKEEDQSSSMSLVQKVSSPGVQQRFEEALFDDWSLDQSTSSLKKHRTFDGDDDFEVEEEVSDEATWISADVYDDGPEYRDKAFPHTKTMFERLHALFGLRKFRSNQEEAINCAMERRFHLFVLMPTGGGKSLCYQLPAVLDDGITFVVSPLRSLILDQTQKLLSLGISSAALTGDRTPAEVSSIYAQCYAPDSKLKLVYITPEKIGSSEQLNKLFSHLYIKERLARFVIDEAHCISDWGHDFRPDYVKIGGLRDRYPRVPFILLTATATPRVQRDMLHQMKLERKLSKLFIQSFNRSNLVYKCFLKGKTDGALARTAQLCLSEQFVGLCGIVYCFSRAECERSAKYLSQSGVTAQAYHAGLEDQDRANVQTQWANDEYQVICATIAFGMGIDKPNVRFVIHLSMPKSIEGYYQESGRAGRDGEQAYCYLFYSYQDLVKTKRLIMTEQSPNATWDAKKVRIDNLNRVYAYCLNNVDCRRTLLLEYFGEQYLSSQCKRHVQTRCDNCCSVAKTKSVDFTALSRQICALVDQLTRQSKSATINQVVDILKGSKQKAIKDAGYDKLEQFNIAEDVTRNNLERLLSKLILDGYLYQDISINDTYGTASAYIRVGKESVFSTPVTLSICVQKENENIASTIAKNSSRDRLVDSCLSQLKDELKSISAEHNIKYSTILSEKALKQMASIMPKSKEEMLKKILEMTTIKYDMYRFDRLLSITCQFRAKSDEETTDNSSFKRKRETPTTSSYFQENTNQFVKKKK